MDRAPVYVLLGFGGMLGNAFYRALCERHVADYRIYAFDHARIDITHLGQVRPVIEYLRPTCVINCAAASDLEICEKARLGSFVVNARGPEIVASECARVGAKLLHVSTYQVFGGARKTPYLESTTTGPVNQYGLSKLEGEVAIRKVLSNHLIIRPGWLFTYEARNILTDWIGKMDRGSNVIVRGECRGSPTFVPDLVDAALDLADMDAKGIFHVANAGGASFEEVASDVVSLCKSNSNVMVAPPVLHSLFKVSIPAYGVLSTRKHDSLAKHRVRPWRDALRQCLAMMGRYKP